METNIVYFDETGDDGITETSSENFILTSIYMKSENWQKNYNQMKFLRKELKDKYGFHIKEEMHTKHFLTDKNPYRKYDWSKEEKIEILKAFTLAIADMDLTCINVIIDKNKIMKKDYEILETALKYNIQRIDNDSKGEWNYIIITDKGRIAPMRKTARAIRAYNPIQSKYSHAFQNQPISGLVEDIMEKDSEESYFIQICDFISYFVHLYYKCCIKKNNLPNRVANLIDEKFIGSVMATLKKSNTFNLNANKSNSYGLVIYPK